MGWGGQRILTLLKYFRLSFCPDCVFLKCPCSHPEISARSWEVLTSEGAKQSWQWPCSVINSFTQAQELSLPVCLPVAGQGLQGAEGRRVPALLMLGEIFVPEHSMISWTQSISEQPGESREAGLLPEQVDVQTNLCVGIWIYIYGSVSVHVYIYLFICAFLCTHCRASLPWVVPYSTQSCSDTLGCFSVIMAGCSRSKPAPQAGTPPSPSQGCTIPAVCKLHQALGRGGWMVLSSAVSMAQLMGVSDCGFVWEPLHCSYNLSPHLCFIVLFPVSLWFPAQQSNHPFNIKLIEQVTNPPLMKCRELT